MCLREEDIIENEVRDLKRGQIMRRFKAEVRDFETWGIFLDRN